MNEIDFNKEMKSKNLYFRTDTRSKIKNVFDGI